MKFLKDHFLVRAPSNIALIKYMGKTDSTLNLPENSSLSMTLDSLSTYMSAKVVDGAGDLRVKTGFDEQIGGVSSSHLQVPELKGAGLEKMSRHWKRVNDAASNLLGEVGFRARPDGPSSVMLQTANTFPMGSGIASSASSFAALTLVGLIANTSEAEREKLRMLWRENTPEVTRLKRQCAKISRQGSGSSCRSFEGPWVEWSEESASAFATKMPEMAHFVVVISRTEKLVSSSQAHLKVKTSSQWPGRVERVTRRFAQMKKSMEEGRVAEVARFSWNEMWEMHNLFHTASEPFTYWQPGTLNALHSFSDDMKSDSPPIVTLDAGPNVHVLVPQTEGGRWKEILSQRFGAENILSDHQGKGAEIL
jgi:diphosphomevalonate decarboxylase